MSRPIKNVLVLGATGNTGIPVIQALAQGPYTITAVSRQPIDPSTSPFPATVRLATTDYTTTSLSALFTGQDAVVATLPGPLYAEQARMAAVAQAAGVRRFVPTEFGMDTQDPAAGELVPSLEGKRATVRALRELAAARGDFSWTAVVVGQFFDWGMKLDGLNGWEVRARRATVFDGGERAFEATTVRRVGEAVAAVLAERNFEATRDQYVYVNSFTVTQNQVLAALEKVTGDKFEVKAGKTEELRAASMAKFRQDPEDFMAVLGLIVAAFYSGKDVMNYSRTREIWNDRLGLKQESLEEVVAEVVKELDGKA